jgi:sn-glycerol 3-phosphate transport system permease protein
LLSLLVLFPVYMLLLRALSNPIAYINAGQPLTLVQPEWDVFGRAFSQGNLGRAMTLSAIVRPSE